MSEIRRLKQALRPTSRQSVEWNPRYGWLYGVQGREGVWVASCPSLGNVEQFRSIVAFGLWNARKTDVQGQSPEAQ